MTCQLVSFYVLYTVHISVNFHSNLVSSDSTNFVISFFIAEMISFKDNSDMIFRTAFFLLSPHVPGDKDSGKDNSDSQNSLGDSGDSVEIESGAFDFDSESEDLLKYYKTPMQFGTENSTVITSQVGSTAHVPCRIHHIGEGVVSYCFIDSF